MCLFIRVLDGVSVIYLKDITEAYPLSYHGILVYLSSASGNLEVRALGKTAGLLLTGVAGIEPATNRLTADRSTAELHSNKIRIAYNPSCILQYLQCHSSHPVDVVADQIPGERLGGGHQ